VADERAKEFVGIEADSTCLHAWREKVNHEVDKAYTYEHMDLADEALELIFSRKREEFGAKVNRDCRRLRKRRAKPSEMLDYLLKRREWIYAARDMKASAPDVEFPTHLRGTGAEERMAGVLGMQPRSEPTCARANPRV